MNGFYQPNWQGVFGPSLDRFQQQAQQSNQPRGFGFGMGGGGGLGGMFGNFMRQSAQGRAMRNGMIPQQPQGNPLAQQQALMMEAQGRGLPMDQSWVNGGQPNMDAQTKPIMGQAMGVPAVGQRQAGSPEQNQAAVQQLQRLFQQQYGGGLGGLMAGFGRPRQNPMPAKRLTR